MTPTNRPHLTPRFFAVSFICFGLLGIGSACQTGTSDVDLDGYTVAQGDCNDLDATIHPGVIHSECNDDTDFNCDGHLGAGVARGSPLSVDIPAITLTLDLTLDGNPIDASNTTSADYGKVELEEVNTGERVAIARAYDLTLATPQSHFEIPIVPGTYNVLYSVDQDGPHWPDNVRARLLSQLSLTADSALALNIPVAPLTVALTLNGQEVSTTNTSPLDEGAIELRDVVTGGQFKLFSTWNDSSGTPAPAHTAQVIPGTYDVYYAAAGGGPSWPLNPVAVLETGVIHASGTELAYNIQTIRLSPQLTLDGAPISAENSSADDEGAILLQGDEDSAPFQVFSAWDDSAGTPNLTPVTLLPGRYSVLYSILDAGLHWPHNGNKVLQRALSLTEDTTLPLDIQTVTFSLTATLNGDPISSDNSGMLDEGSFLLRDRSSGRTFELFSAWDDSAALPRAEASLKVLPGEYDLLYGVTDAGTHWPHNELALLKTALDVSADVSLDLDLQTVQTSLDVTLDGQPISTTNTTALDTATFRLRDTLTGDSFRLGSVWDALQGTPTTSLEIPVLPITYDLVYSSETAGSLWPVASSRVLLPGLALSAFTGDAVTEFALNLESAELIVDMALDGQPLSAENTSASSYGSLLLVDRDNGETAVRLESLDPLSGLPTSQRSLRLLPGSYQLVYDGGAGAGAWPLANRVILDCFTLE